VAETPNSAAPTVSEPPSTTDPVITPVVEPPITPEIITPVIADSPVTPEPAATPTVEPAATPTVEPPTTPEPVITPGTSEPPVTPAIAEPLVTPAIRDEPAAPTIRDEPMDPSPIITPSVAPSVMPGPGETIYVVREGDAGFWGIAERVYGDGRHWPLIAKANPNADTNALRPGERLRIPPKPDERLTSPTSAEPAAAISPLTGGTYVVQRGDAGFWGIAQKVYGSGKHWPAIAKANPKANSSSLRPGDKLVIPPRSDLSPAKATPAAAPLVAGPGQEIYVVKETDTAGFWGIAKSLYGSGKYWPEIAKANPTVQSGALRAGQKLLVPTLTDAARDRYARPTTRTIGPTEPRIIEDDPRPIFD
jgi:nucleoid-associated protein YgaU